MPLLTAVHAPVALVREEVLRTIVPYGRFLAGIFGLNQGKLARSDSETHVVVFIFMEVRLGDRSF